MKRGRCAPQFLVGLIFGIFTLFGSSHASITFERAYGGPDYDEGLCVQQTSDRGYVVAGWGGFSLMKTDSLGDSLWSTHFAVPGSSYFRMESVQQTSDGGYVIAGGFALAGSWDDACLVKTDSLGNMLWSRTYGGTHGDRAFCVDRTLDGGYVLVGVTNSLGDSIGYIYLVKTDSLGDTLWTRAYGDTLEDIGRSVQQTFDGGYIITGEANYSYFDGDVSLIKVDSLGDSLWSRTYGDVEWESGSSVQQTTDGGYIIVGTANYRPVAPFSGDVYLIKTDASGDSLWSKLYYRGGHIDEGASVRQTFDGGYIITGTTQSVGAGKRDVFLIKTDSLGDTLWTRTFGRGGTDLANSVWVTSDSGYIITGSTKYYGTHFHDVYLIKTNDIGRLIPKRDVGVLSLDEPPDTVITDSTYFVKATLANYGNVMDTFYVVVTIDGYADTVEVAELDPGSSYQVWFDFWRVPPIDSTLYTMAVCTYIVDDLDPGNDCAEKTIFAYNPTGTEEEFDGRSPVTDFRLWQNQPNPFYRSTVIGYSLPVGCAVSLRVYDITGRHVETLVHEHQDAGVYHVNWSGKHHANSIYFYRLKAGDFTDTKQIILLR